MGGKFPAVTEPVHDDKKRTQRDTEIHPGPRIGRCQSLHRLNVILW